MSVLLKLLLTHFITYITFYIIGIGIAIIDLVIGPEYEKNIFLVIFGGALYLSVLFFLICFVHSGLLLTTIFYYFKLTNRFISIILIIETIAILVILFFVRSKESNILYLIPFTVLPLGQYYKLYTIKKILTDSLVPKDNPYKVNKDKTN